MIRSHNHDKESLRLELCTNFINYHIIKCHDDEIRKAHFSLIDKRYDIDAIEEDS